MSYEIYYDRAFIQVNDRFIPMVNEGSNNTFEVNYRGREIPDKNWEVLNWKHRNRLLFSKDEIFTIAHDYEMESQESGTCFISRNRSFETGKFERWILNGLRSAHTIEEYVSYGNRLEILDYSGKMEEWKHYPFSTTSEFLNLLASLKSCTMLNVHFLDNREVCRPKAKRKKPQKLLASDMDEYFVLSAEYGAAKTKIYFSSLTRSGIRYVYSPTSGWVRVFLKKADAEKYIEKNVQRFLRVKFEVERIRRNAA